jgi:Icc protein
MHIAIVSDLHTAIEGEHPFDVDVRKNFQDIIHQIATSQPDYLIITGDLCFKQGDEEVYKWQKQILDNTDIPYFLIPGNHDDTALMVHVFDHLPAMSGVELYYEEILDATPVLFLDSAKGYLSKDQKRWLSKKLSEQQQAVICMHHPPDFMAVPHMDGRYHLQDREEVMHILLDAAIPIYLFCGHYHVDKSAHIGPLHIFITPSCFFQIDASQKDFAIDHKRIAYRSVHIKNGRLDTKIHYFEGNGV